VGSLAGSGADGAGKIGEGTANKFPTDVEPEHVAGLGADLVEHGGRAAYAGAVAGDPHEAVMLEVGESKCHGRFGEPGYPSQLSSRERTVLANLLEQELLVHHPDELRASSSLTDGPRHQRFGVRRDALTCMDIDAARSLLSKK
jgi:hypothetical protein